MSYFVAYNDGQSVQFETFDAALDEYRSRPEPRALYGAGYDVDCDQDGFFVCCDGLTDEERERLLDEP